MTPSLSGLATSLAQPVVLGLLPEAQAHAAIMLAVYRGSTDHTDIPGQFRAWRHILGLHIANLEVRRDLARASIHRALRPMIELRKRSNHLFAAAHDANGSLGFPLREDEVNDVVTLQMRWAMKAKSHV